MANIIRIKRSTGSVAPGTLKNAELAYAEGNSTLYIGTGISTGDTASAIVKIGGPGAFMTFDTAQTPSGTKTFSIGASGTLKISGAASGQVLTADGTSGQLTWSSITGNSYSTISGNTGSNISASGAETLSLVGTGAISVATATGTPDTATISVAQATTGVLGVVQLATAINAETTDKAVTPNLLKDYVDTKVDSVASGLDVKGSCRVATTTALSGPAATYSVANKTLEGNSNGALPQIDGVTLLKNQRILVKNQTNAWENGIYVVSQVGSISQKYLLTRASDADLNSGLIPAERTISAGMFCFIEEGTTNADTGWVLTSNDPIVITNTTLANNSQLNFTQFAGAGTVTVTSPLTRSGNEISLGTVPASLGGTGQTAYTVGDILYCDTTNTLSKLSIPVGAGAEDVLKLNGGKPAWGKVQLSATTKAVTGTLPIDNGGTGATTADGALGQLGANTVGLNIFKLTNPSAVTFLRINANNTITTRSAADFRSDIQAGTGNGTVTNVTGTSPISVTSSTSTPAISLAAGYGDTQNPYGVKTPNHVLAGPSSGSTSVAPTFRALVANDIPNISTDKLTSGTLPVTRGGTGLTAVGTGVILAGGAAGDNTQGQIVTISQGLAGSVLRCNLDTSDSTPSFGPIDLANSEAAVNGTLKATNGGTGHSTYAVGDLLVGGASNTLSKLADVALGNVLISGGVGAAPSYGKVGLTSHISGILAVGNGGTGATTLTGVLKGNGTSAFTAATAGTDFVVAGTPTVGKIVFAAGTTTIASANIPSGVAPSAPGDGDIWHEAGSLKFRYGTTKTLLLDDTTLDGGNFG